MYRETLLNDNFICLPDPINIMEWYYVVFNLNKDEFKGGFYMGVIKDIHHTSQKTIPFSFPYRISSNSFKGCVQSYGTHLGSKVKSTMVFINFGLELNIHLIPFTINNMENYQAK